MISRGITYRWGLGAGRGILTTELANDLQEQPMTLIYNPDKSSDSALNPMAFFIHQFQNMLDLCL